MERDFVPKAESVALKRLGFDEPCFAFFTCDNKDGRFDTPSRAINWNERIEGQDLHQEEFVSRPLYSQAFRWFREKHNLPSHIYTGDSEKYHYAILKEGRYVVSGKYKLESYEDAELICLQNLIEIIKNNLV